MNENNNRNDIFEFTSQAEMPYLTGYYLVGIIPFAFLIFFITFFLPAKNKQEIIFPSQTLVKENILTEPDKSEFNYLHSKLLCLIVSLIFIGFLYTEVFSYYPLIIVYPDSVPIHFDPFIYYTLMFLIVSFLLLCHMIYRYKVDIKKEEILFLAFFMFSSLIILFQGNLICLFICLELFSISSYLLVAGLGSKVSIEASIKYSLTGLFGTVFFLIGITFAFINYQTVNIHLISLYVHYELINTTGEAYPSYCGLFFLIALFLKLGVAPFQFWIIDVYKGTSPVTFIWLITFSKVILIFILINMLDQVLDHSCVNYEYIFLGLSILSIIVGSIGGLRQSNLKGLFAYSSLVTLGYTLLPFAYYYETPSFAISIALSSLVVYVFNLFSFFFFLSKFKDIAGVFNNFFESSNIMKANPVLGYGFIISLFSFMGLPPLLGFYPKLILLKTLFQAGYVLPVAIVLICTLLTSFYYFFIIKQLIFKKDTTYTEYKRVTILDYIIIGFLIFMNCFVLFYFDDLLEFIVTLF